MPTIVPHQMVIFSGIISLIHVFLCFLQWIQCDMRYFDMTVLGKFSVVMADPPWDIHMEVHTAFYYSTTVLLINTLTQNQRSPITPRNELLLYFLRQQITAHSNAPSPKKQ